MRDTFLAFGTPDFTDEEINAVNRVMRSGWIGMGPETISFEKELRTYLNAPEVVTVNSCTSALFLSLLVEGIGPGDEVIVPSLTWCATANAALYLGATPVFCDVDPDTMIATPQTISSCLTSKTKAVFVVHYGGLAADIESIRQSIPDNVVIIEDAAHAIGALYPNGDKVGSSGNSVCFSFYANKNLSTGEGGAIALFDSEKAERLRTLRMSGQSANAWARYISPSSVFIPPFDQLGYKMNYTDLQAAIGRVQLQRLEEMAIRRKFIAQRYLDKFNEFSIVTAFQKGIADNGHARHLLVCKFDKSLTGMSRNDFILTLRELNIGASIHYRPLHIQSLYSRFFTHLPNTEALYDQLVTLPISARMTSDDVDYVCDTINSIIQE
jgi:dTDP-4-amino-4,6-dideoxygalactose transaminase